MHQQPHFTPPNGCLSEEHVKHALETYFPQYDGISPKLILEALNQYFNYPLTAGEFERQLKNTNSFISQALFICLMIVNDKLAFDAMIHHSHLLAALKDQLHDLKNADVSHEFIVNMDNAQNDAQQLEDALNRKHKILQQVEIKTKLLQNYFNQISEYKINHSLLSVQLRQQKQNDTQQFNELVRQRGFKKLRFTPSLHAKLDQAAEALVEKYELNSTAFAVSFQDEFDKVMGNYLHTQKEILQEDKDNYATYQRDLKQLKLNHVRARYPLQLQLKANTNRIHQLEQEALQLKADLFNVGGQLNFSNAYFFQKLSNVSSYLEELEKQRQHQFHYYNPAMGFAPA